MGTAVGKLIRVRPYHGAGASVPQVWHDRSDCEQGRWIPSAALRPGTGQRERCPECARLDEAAPVDPAAVVAPMTTRTMHTPRSLAANSERVEITDRRRPGVGTVVGVVATAVLLVLGGLWLGGSLRSGHDDVAATLASASPTTTTTKQQVAPSLAAVLAAAAKAHAAPAATIPAPAAPAAADTAASDVVVDATEPQGKGSFYVGSDGYTHGTESDGEVCSNNPDDPQWPCSYEVPGSDGFGAPLPEDPSDSAPSAAAPAGASSVQPGAGRDPAAAAAARAQRQAARQAARANRQK